MASRSGAVFDEFSSMRSLQAALDAGHIGTWTWDIAHDRIAWSEGFELAHGFSPGSLPHSLTAYEQHIHPEDRARIVAALQGCAAANEAYSVAYRLIDPAGKTHYVEAHGQVVRDANGTTTGLVGVCTDVTERRELLDALNEAEGRFRTMADNSPVLIWQTDTAGGGYVNRYYLEFFGVTMESLAEMKWVELLHPDDFAGYLDAYQSAFERQERYEHVCRFRRADGEYRWLHNIGVPHRGPDGAFTGFIGCSFDVTDRIELLEREREARVVAETARAQYRTLAETIPQQVWTSTSEGALDFVNQRVLDYFGRTSDEMIGAGWQAVVHPDDLAGVVERWTQSLQSGDEYEVEFRLRRHDGVDRWHLGRAIPVRNEDGAILKWLGTNTDIDDQKTAREQLRTANKLKDRFLSIAAHDLRTPMTGILGWTQILRMDVDEETRNEALHWIEQSVQSQARLIEDLLDSTRIREGKFALNRETIDLEPIVVAAFTTVASSAAERGVVLMPPETTQAIVFGDPARLQQVIWNLLSNAIKFTPAGKPVRLFLRTDDSTATVIVEDEGEGIDAGFLPHIFQPFEQDDKGERSGGLGLGLHIVATIVKMHGGTVDAQSDGTGKGARFVFRIPLG